VAALTAVIVKPTNGPGAQSCKHLDAPHAEKAASAAEGSAARLRALNVIPCPTAPPCSCHAALALAISAAIAPGRAPAIDIRASAPRALAAREEDETAQA
jgi:hypothetical protein